MLSLSRRAFLENGTIMLIASTGISSVAWSDSLPMLSEADPVPMGLGYMVNGSAVDAAKFPQYAAGQTCANCALYQGAAGAPSGACLFMLEKRYRQMAGAFPTRRGGKETRGLAIYFAAQTVAQVPAATLGKCEALFLAGDSVRGIPPCQGCHADDARGKPGLAKAAHGARRRLRSRGWPLNYRPA